MAKTEQEIWPEMLTVGKFGNLQWVETIENNVYSNPEIGGETRRFPERCIAMAGRLLSPKELGKNAFSVDEYTQTSPHRAEIQHESTGVNGLLRVADMIEKTSICPENIVQIGAFSPQSVFITMNWIQNNGWNNTYLTLVEPSPIPIKHFEALKKKQLFKWPENFSIVQDDFRKYSPKKPVDIVICDILSSWTIPTYYAPHIEQSSPYKSYEEIINNASQIIQDSGKLYSRCLVFPNKKEDSHLNPTSEKIVKERLSFVLDNIGRLKEQVNIEHTSHNLQVMFDQTSPPTYCGLEHVHKLFGNAPTLSGPSCENVLRRIHHRNFSNVKEMKVVDTASDCNFITFVCNNQLT